MKYEVEITCTGTVIVEADSEALAFNKVLCMPASEINQKGNLTSWEPSDVTEVD